MNKDLTEKQSLGRIKRPKIEPSVTIINENVPLTFEDVPLPIEHYEQFRHFKGTNEYGRGMSASFICIDECAYIPAYVMRNFMRAKYRRKPRKRKGL